MNAETILVVGAGMVGHRCCARLRELDAKRRFRVVLIGEEPRAPYDRVNLTHYYDTRDPNELLLAQASFYDEQGIELHLQRAVTAIDREARSSARPACPQDPTERADPATFQYVRRSGSRGVASAD